MKINYWLNSGYNNHQGYLCLNGRSLSFAIDMQSFTNKPISERFDIMKNSAVT